ncbi:hypothetical protein M0R45_016555 [Rubus argutus]|uniref:Secreted protein n=1 Tax=Rubus argutus TaxID=59490 RepID=A0AAW1XTP5_RUBAR
MWLCFFTASAASLPCRAAFAATTSLKHPRLALPPSPSFPHDVAIPISTIDGSLFHRTAIGVFFPIHRRRWSLFQICRQSMFNVVATSSLY